MSSLVPVDYDSDSDESGDDNSRVVCGDPAHTPNNKNVDDDSQSTDKSAIGTLISDEEDDFVPAAAVATAISDEDGGIPAVGVAVKGSVSSDDSSTDYSDDSDSNDQTDTVLPSPFTTNVTSTEATNEVMSVFTNKYREAELAKMSILEKHVKLSNYVDPKAKDERKKFRKGKRKAGRGGNVNKGERVSSVNKIPLGNQRTGVDASGSFMSTSEARSHLPTSHRGNMRRRDNDCDDDDKVERKKFRAGLSNSITPSKKVFDAYKRQQAADQNT